MTKNPNKKERKPIVSGKFYVAPVKIGKKDITIKLPLKVAEYFKITNNEIYWAPTNGVIQLSGGQPQMVIPMLTEGNDQFVPQTE